MKKLMTCGLLALTAAAIPVAAFAQFSLPSLPGKSSGGSQADLGGQQTALVKNFIAANVDVLKANAKMADALGLKGKAGDADATVQSLSSGATDKDSASKAATAVGDTGGAIAAKLAEKPQLDAAAKATYAAGLVHLVAGARKFSGMGKDVTDMSNGLKSASPMQLPSLGGATYVVSNFPTSASNVTKALKNAIDFAKSNGIEVPADATSAL
ncbi:hypothetical protein [Ramlibacter sp.]